MTSFNITTSTATIAPQVLSLGSETGFIGSFASLVVTGDEQDIAVEIAASGGGAFLMNNGAIVAEVYGVLARATFRLVNNGIISTEGIAVAQSISSSTTASSTIHNTGSIISSAASALSIEEGGAMIFNDGYISGMQAAVSLGAVGALATSWIFNSGTMASLGVFGAALRASSSLNLQNTGEILGDVSCSNDSDTIDTRDGTITGTISLGDGGNVLRGSAGEDIVTSGIHADLLRGNDGDDNLRSTGGSDTLYGGRDDDYLLSTGGNSFQYGGNGDDSLTGGTSSDQLFGGAGDDLIIGHGGPDDLFGGSGADQFKFLAPADSGPAAAADVIGDFQRGADHIDLRSLTGAFAFVGTGPLLGGGDRSVGYVKAGSALRVRIDTDGDGDVDMNIVVQGAIQLSAADFLL